MSAALRCEALPCVSSITWIPFAARAGLIWPPTTSGTRLSLPSRSIRSVPSGRQRLIFLPAGTDIPLGAWTVAAVLDTLEASTGRTDLAPGADAAVAIGLAGALGSAVTGLTQWYPLGGPPRKIGAAHALLNVTATGLFAASFALRRGGRRGAARLLGWLGYGVVSAGAYLGGAPVYEQRVGVDHAPREGLPRDFLPVLA